MKKPVLAVAVLAATLLSGCATEQMKQDIAEARALAEEANIKADRALSNSEDAQACCRDNSEKLDRMFRKAMMK